MKLKIFFISLLNLLVALAVNPANAKNLFVSDICEEALALEKKLMQPKLNL